MQQSSYNGMIKIPNEILDLTPLYIEFYMREVALKRYYDMIKAAPDYEYYKMILDLMMDQGSIDHYNVSWYQTPELLDHVLDHLSNGSVDIESIESEVSCINYKKGFIIEQIKTGFSANADNFYIFWRKVFGISVNDIYLRFRDNHTTKLYKLIKWYNKVSYDKVIEIVDKDEHPLYTTPIPEEISSLHPIYIHCYVREKYRSQFFSILYKRLPHWYNGTETSRLIYFFKNNIQRIKLYPTDHLCQTQELLEKFLVYYNYYNDYDKEKEEETIEKQRKFWNMWKSIDWPLPTFTMFFFLAKVLDMSLDTLDKLWMQPSKLQSKDNEVRKTFLEDVTKMYNRNSLDILMTNLEVEMLELKELYSIND